MNTKLATAIQYHDLGLSVIPLQSNSKKSTVAWTPYQKVLPSRDQLHSWFANDSSAGVAIVCGSVSGNLIVRDFDTRVAYEWSNIGCWHLNTWLYSLVELACWDRPADELVDRSDRSWDNPDRRPSHADRRCQIRREMLEQQFLLDLPPDFKHTKLLDRIKHVLALAA